MTEEGKLMRWFLVHIAKCESGMINAGRIFKGKRYFIIEMK